MVGLQTSVAPFFLFVHDWYVYSMFYRQQGMTIIYTIIKRTTRLHTLGGVAVGRDHFNNC